MMNLSSNIFAFFNGISNGSFLHGGRGSDSSISGAWNNNKKKKKQQISNSIVIYIVKQ